MREFIAMGDARTDNMYSNMNSGRFTATRYGSYLMVMDHGELFMVLSPLLIL